MTDLDQRTHEQEAHRTRLAIAFFFTALIFFTLTLLTASQPTETATKSYTECDTDQDCLDKNGCGGYADPCTEEGQ